MGHNHKTKGWGHISNGRAIGIDGARGGWVCAALENEQLKLEFVSSLSEISLESGDRALIDMPIGFPSSGPRMCDGEAARAAALEQGSKTAPWGDEYRSALAAQTHLPFFNEWVSELETTGYLHNHTRMWFASVWIFTLKLPWQLGALHMYRHLLDGDPASNTLSWRWVAGLQTKGKSYLARPDNIEKYSEGRWRPKQGELAEEAFLIQEEDAVSTHTPRATPSRLPPYSPGQQKLGLLMTLDDISIDTELFPTKEIASIGLFAPQMTLGESQR